ncbi:hypothetical protein HDU96_000419 [Phlyctochytrium bullatum]|nr:hypothetical protein HDU96_000419 [Phlyctochytrium bullatum]
MASSPAEASPATPPMIPSSPQPAPATPKTPSSSAFKNLLFFRKKPQDPSPSSTTATSSSPIPSISTSTSTSTSSATIETDPPATHDPVQAIPLPSAELDSLDASQIAQLQRAPTLVDVGLKAMEGEALPTPPGSDDGRGESKDAVGSAIPNTLTDAGPKDPVRGKWFDRIMIINLENTDYKDAIRDPHLATLHHPTPTFPGGVLCTRFYALRHPSQPNYFAQILGDTAVTTDGMYDLRCTSIVDLLEAKGVTWGAYMEGYPDGLKPNQICLDEHCANGTYVRRHNPFASIVNIQKNPKRVCHIKSGHQFHRDLASSSLPQYIFYTPDNNNNGHDTGIAYAGAYIQRFLVPLLSDPRLMGARTLVVLTFDEDSGWLVAGNRVATWLLGECVERGAVGEDRTKYNHYSILRTVEENWGLGDLKRCDAKATAFRCLRTEG